MTEKICFQTEANHQNPDIILVHGAGAGLDSDFLVAAREGFEARGVTVTGVEFNYMAQSRVSGKRRPPPPVDRLVEELGEAVRAMEKPVVIVGKSMGGRVASMLALPGLAPANLSGVIVLGYPFHPPGKEHTLRVEHFDRISVPLMILQGSRDPFGKQAEISALFGERHWSDEIELLWLDSGDHDFQPTKRSGKTRELLLDEALDAAVKWLQHRWLSSV
ncbi:alpha/beta fold hydrolase [Candidatus Thalassolituus haligoni]|uniref:alpha/beta fold hydrolase n=1 Tax=Candidatus Thalassolituus haligoni TaxID=3100113 RepID=UPI0035123415